MSPWRWNQIKGSKHVGQWNCTINVIKLYILSDYKYIVVIIRTSVNKIYVIAQHCNFFLILWILNKSVTVVEFHAAEENPSLAHIGATYKTLNGRNEGRNVTNES
jgi:hypothetical protein